ncbi:MAG TPA: hypothetical protein VJ476_05490 [Rhizomicrobium sp.]|nr:hypothetical protein [Rhizomicrobium sp.]
MTSNPASIRWIVAMMALYLHVGPYSRDVIGRIDTMAAALEPVVDRSRIADASQSLAI